MTTGIIIDLTIKPIMDKILEKTIISSFHYSMILRLRTDSDLTKTPYFH